MIVSVFPSSYTTPHPLHFFKFLLGPSMSICCCCRACTALQNFFLLLPNPKKVKEAPLFEGAKIWRKFVVLLDNNVHKNLDISLYVSRKWNIIKPCKCSISRNSKYSIQKLRETEMTLSLPRACLVLGSCSRRPHSSTPVVTTAQSLASHATQSSESSSFKGAVLNALKKAKSCAQSVKEWAKPPTKATLASKRWVDLLAIAISRNDSSNGEETRIRDVSDHRLYQTCFPLSTLLSR